MALRCRRHNGKAKKRIRHQLSVRVNAEAGHHRDTQMLTLYLRFVIPLSKLDTVQTNDVTNSGGTRALQSVLKKKVDDDNRRSLNAGCFYLDEETGPHGL